MKIVHEIGFFTDVKNFFSTPLKSIYMKEKFTSEYKRKSKLVLKSKLNGRNKILAIKK